MEWWIAILVNNRGEEKKGNCGWPPFVEKISRHLVARRQTVFQHFNQSKSGHNIYARYLFDFIGCWFIYLYRYFCYKPDFSQYVWFRQLKRKTNYSEVSIKRAGLLNYFLAIFHTACKFSCNEWKIPPCSLLAINYYAISICLHLN